MAVSLPDKNLVRIIFNELGRNSADLFVKFYSGFSHTEQYEGAKNTLSLTVGQERTNELFKNIKLKPDT